MLEDAPLVGLDGPSLEFERRAARDHVVQHAAERVEVGSGIGRRTGPLLGGHVLRRADDLRAVPCASRLPCDAKVQDLGIVGLAELRHEHDVLGLDVPMHEALLVGVH